MAKLGRNESVQVEVLTRICEVLNCNVEDIIEFEKKEGDSNE